MADPFDCFGDEENEEVPINVSNSTMDIKRAETCGVLSFHKHTENALIMHLQSSFSQSPSVQQILLAVDEFCFHRHWMMHIGPEKGNILAGILENEIQIFLQDSNVHSMNETNATLAFSCIELGTYCAYSSILIGNILQRFSLLHPNIRFHLYTFEIQPEFIKVANAMIRLAQLQDYITLIPINLYLDGSVDDISILTETNIKRNNPSLTSPHIHFLFMDHDKDRYLLDVKNFEQSGLIKQGTSVVADNVLFAEIDDYLYHMRTLHDRHIVKTRTIESIVEYSDANEIKDGLEFTKYIRDPDLDKS